MRRDFLNITAKLSKVAHVQKAAYNVCRVLLSNRKPKISDAEAYLSTLSPEKKNSCIEEHQLALKPEYDLQIIMPAYNVSKYIDECMRSVLAQKTRYSYLLVVVDDGSTDDTPILLQKYTSYPNVKIIKQVNQGPSAARNNGLQYINARYVAFIDADDSLPENAVETLVSKADYSQTDILEGSHRYFRGNKIVHVRRFSEELSASVRFTSFAWGKVYQAHIWQHIGFPVGYWFEDMMVLLILSPITTKKGLISEIVYNYRDTPTGFTRAYNKDKRRVESYWVTKQLLTDAKVLGIPPTVYFYERFLQCCTMSTRRVAILGDHKADYALFEAQRQLRDTYFKDLRAQGQKEKRIESAFLNDDFKEYLLYCLFLH